MIVSFLKAGSKAFSKRSSAYILLLKIYIATAVSSNIKVKNKKWNVLYDLR
jgi:hypothetical protein